MGKLYKVQMRESESAPWVDLRPLKGMYEHRNHTYAEARGIVSDYKGLSGTRNFRCVVQRETPEQLLEMDLHREAVRKASLPHITRRLVEDHLGQREYVHRIEITILGEEFYHVATSSKESKGNKEQLIQVMFKMLTHIRNGGLLNLEHWAPIQYAHV